MTSMETLMRLLGSGYILLFYICIYIFYCVNIYILTKKILNFKWLYEFISWLWTDKMTLYSPENNLTLKNSTCI